MRVRARVKLRARLRLRVRGRVRVRVGVNPNPNTNQGAPVKQPATGPVKSEIMPYGCSKAITTSFQTK